MAWTVYATIGLYALSQVIPELGSPTLLYVLVTSQILRFSLRDFKYSLDIFLSVCFLLLYAMFSINLQYFSSLDSILAVAFFILFSDALIFFDKAPRAPELVSRARRQPLYFAFILAALAIAFGMYLLPIASLSFLIPVGVALYFQEALLRTGQGRLGAWSVFLIFAAAIFLYMALHWSGFGRLVIASTLLMPFAILTYYQSTPVKYWHLVLAAPFLAILAFVFRGGSSENLLSETAIGVTDHLIYTKWLSDGFLPLNTGLKNFLDQYWLFFLNWVPREWWEAKPVGVGYYAVDFFGQRHRVGEEHNISLGFVGEQIFFLDAYYVFGLLVVLATILMARRLLISLVPSFGIAALVAFDGTLITFFWGGMASFGSRVWFVITPILLLALASRVRIGAGRRRSDAKHSQAVSLQATPSHPV